MALKTLPPHLEEQQRREHIQDRRHRQQVRMLADAWEQGLLSDEEFEHAQQRLLDLGNPYLVTIN